MRFLRFVCLLSVCALIGCGGTEIVTLGDSPGMKELYPDYKHHFPVGEPWSESQTFMEKDTSMVFGVFDGLRYATYTGLESPVEALADSDSLAGDHAMVRLRIPNDSTLSATLLDSTYSEILKLDVQGRFVGNHFITLQKRIHTPGIMRSMDYKSQRVLYITEEGYLTSVSLLSTYGSFFIISGGGGGSATYVYRRATEQEQLPQ